MASNLGRAVYRTSFNPGVLNYSTSYYWQVNVRNGGGVTTGAVWSFSTLPNIPAQVAKGNPANGAVDQPLSLVLTWTAAAQATSYNIYFGTTVTLIAANKLNNTTGLVYTLTGLSYITTYYWRVDAVNLDGANTGMTWDFSTGTEPVPAQATGGSPVSGTANCALTTQLYWLSGSDASAYDVYFGTTNPPPVAVSNMSKSVYRTSYNPGTLTPATTYYWRVDAQQRRRHHRQISGISPRCPDYLHR